MPCTEMSSLSMSTSPTQHEQDRYTVVSSCLVRHWSFYLQSRSLQLVFNWLNPSFYFVMINNFFIFTMRENVYRTCTFVNTIMFYVLLYIDYVIDWSFQIWLKSHNNYLSISCMFVFIIESFKGLQSEGS